MTVRELLSRIDSAEMSEWMAFSRIEPFPDGYWQAGMVASTMANLWAKGKRYGPQDFMPRARSARDVQDPRESLAIFKAMFPGMGGD